MTARQHSAVAARRRAHRTPDAPLLWASRSTLPLAVMALVVVARLGHAYDAIEIPIRPPILPRIPLLRVPPGGSAPLIIRAADISVSL
jgi:hypothetical protein